MFGMSSKEFWEDDPQLYWSYRISYIKKLEFEAKRQAEMEKYCCWLQGSINNVAFSVALNNAFSKKKIEFPSFNKMFNLENKQENFNTELTERLKGVENKDVRQQIEFNYWARM